MMENYYNFLDENIIEINDKIINACKEAQKNISDITLIGITKTVSSDVIFKAIEKGVVNIGENKVQEMLSKYDDLKSIKHKTHIVGHLQTNKVKYLPHKIDMIQSVDSIKLANTINKEYAKENLLCEVLVEVNIGNENNKTGILYDDTEKLCLEILKLPNIRLKGLMCIPPICENDMVRKYFEKMYALFIDISRKKLDNIYMDTLSMGMSQDYDLAIKEGATMVRIGTSLFGKRN